MVVFGVKLLYSGKSCCIRAKVVVIRVKWLNSGNLVVIGQKWFYSGESGCNCAKVVLF